MMSPAEMPLLNDYSLCRQTVTVYRREGGTVTRTLHGNAYLEHEKAEEVSRTGSSEQGTLLLVIPGATQACRVGDRVYDGVGPEVPETGVDAWWRSFIPAKVEGLAVVRRVGVKRWRGQVVHTEASG